VLLASEKGIEKYKLQAKAEILDYAITGADLQNELLLGPAYAVYQLLYKTGISLEEIAVLEFHEAFAGQVLANIKALASAEFAAKAGYDKPIGQVDMSRLNTWGGSLSIGHPFGATGARLVNTAANRMNMQKAKYALIAACAAGAHGHAMLLKSI
jgi:acetyl-CoA acetyltransferase